MVEHAIFPAFGKRRQEDQEFKASFSNNANLRLPWDVDNLVSNKKKSSFCQIHFKGLGITQLWSFPFREPTFPAGVSVGSSCCSLEV